ncbi:MAG TPA: sugar ABC transporter ATP-binding protein [Puia sp.]|nr:sugar ABC transporter ATP-binding protein [Puia sp.]
MLVAENITKRFSGVVALENVCLELHPGKVNALLGENGAGKSTLMKILSGVYPDYEGRILFRGEEVRFKNTREAQASGIAIIHQELNLVPFLSVAENIFLGSELLTPFGLLDKRRMREKTRQLLQRLALDVDPDAKVASLKVGQQQLVEIAKALLHQAEVIIMDEPTSAIGDKEVKALFDIIANLKREGRIIVYISHKLDELFAIADRYIVLRDGRFIEAGEMKGIGHDELIRKMVGRKLDARLRQRGGSRTGAQVRGAPEVRREIPTEEGTIYRRRPTELLPELLTVRDLCLYSGSRTLKDISFALHKGEVLGIFGLMGAGRTELLESIFGLHGGAVSGAVSLGGKAVSLASPGDAVKAGIALVPEDRKKDGVVPGLSVRQNICITTLPDLATMGVLSDGKEQALAGKYIGSLQIKTSSQKQLVKNLSGGNQQKIVLAKWLATNPSVLMLDEPTRGIDIHAKTEIYRLIMQLADEGMGIIVVSSEMPELLAVADRVLVMCEGSVTAAFGIEEATEDNLLKAALPNV